jgi:F-type H+-transporting ATPase subunit b
MISIDRSIIFQIINFIVLVMLLFRFLFKPVVQALDKRSNHIQDELAKIEKTKSEAEEVKKNYEEESKKIHEKYQEILELANQDAAKIKSKIIDEAYQEGEKIKKTYEEKARLEVEKFFTELKMDIVSISTEIAEKILKEHVDINVQDELIDHLLEEAVSRIENKSDVAYGR